MTLKQISFGKNKWCGPSVISSVTGVTTDEAEKAIQDVLGNRKPVVGVYSNDLCEALHRLGYSTVYYSHLANAGSLFWTVSILSDGVYILAVPGHYIAIEVDGPRRYICDNHTRKPFNVSASARGSQRVVCVIGVTNSLGLT